MTEKSLENNEHRPIIRIGNTVHRPVSYWTPAVHELLKYLESVNFPYSPRVLGFDEQGREILSYIEGVSGKEGWYAIHSDDGLRKMAKLLREYHDAVAGYKLSADTQWAYATGGLADGEIVCHGDFGPWNIVWQNGDPIGIIDWDLVFPAKPQYDVLYALEYAAPFRNDEETLQWHHFSEVPDRKRRIEVFTEAYGPIDISNVVAGVAEVQRSGIQHVRYLADKGMEPQVSWVAEGVLDLTEERAKWTESHKDLFV